MILIGTHFRGSIWPQFGAILNLLSVSVKNGLYLTWTWVAKKKASLVKNYYNSFLISNIARSLDEYHFNTRAMPNN